jgi:hypothetical protein
LPRRRVASRRSGPSRWSWRWRRCLAGRARAKRRDSGRCGHCCGRWRPRPVRGGGLCWERERCRSSTRIPGPSVSSVLRAHWDMHQRPRPCGSCASSTVPSSRHSEKQQRVTPGRMVLRLEPPQPRDLMPLPRPSWEGGLGWHAQGGCVASPPARLTARPAPVSGPPRPLCTSPPPQHGLSPAYTLTPALRVL